MPVVLYSSSLPRLLTDDILIVMDELKPQQDPSHFGTLTGIMERFAQVPYEQFQEELHAWFYTSLSERGIDQKQLRQQGLAGLPELVSAIYHEAEVKQLLHDQSLSHDPDNDQV